MLRIQRVEYEGRCMGCARVWRAAGAVLAALLLLSASLGAATNDLHRVLHDDSGHHHPSCFLCSLAQGQFDVAQPVVGLLQCTAPFTHCFISAVQKDLPIPDIRLAPSRAPPASA